MYKVLTLITWFSILNGFFFYLNCDDCCQCRREEIYGRLLLAEMALRPATFYKKGDELLRAMKSDKISTGPTIYSAIKLAPVFVEGWKAEELDAYPVLKAYLLEADSSKHNIDKQFISEI